MCENLLASFPTATWPGIDLEVAALESPPPDPCHFDVILLPGPVTENGVDGWAPGDELGLREGVTAAP